MYSDAIKSFKNGKPVLIFDNEEREGETDIVIPSQYMTKDFVRIMRKDGGGLICTTIREEDANLLNMPYIEDLYKQSLNMDKSILDASDMKYDKNSTFSITINSRDTFTGISDIDRATTIRQFAEFVGNIRKQGLTSSDFGKQFRTPGHVHLLIATEGYFSRRKGHTEFSTYMMEQSGLIPSATIVETLDDNGKSMIREKAENYAIEHGYGYVTGTEILEHWRDSS
ncbi:3,4-dihydroxy-2-butanone-4-phosphate synthase [Ferroplasma sp.]|uniref:3,4-dihydroxy-2-butanone-4-phosphate synthase n=1 Tax=Ferroplasma sp. TaxID=2591003 RepID=UPI00307F0701